MENNDIAFVLKEIAIYKELAGENPFKTRAFEQAALIIERLQESAANLAEEDKLIEIKGIGKSIDEVVKELVLQGKSTELEELKKAIPPGLEELLALSGMGPKKVRAVWQKLDITTIGELEYACKENRLVTLEGFGTKSQEKILKAIEFKKKYRGQFLYDEALAIAEKIIKQLQASNIFSQITLAGSLRRGKRIVKDADIMVVPGPQTTQQMINRQLISLVDQSTDTDEVIGAGPTKISIRSHGLQIDFRIIRSESYATALQHFTGSKEHNTILRSRAKSMGLLMNEYGIFKDKKVIHPIEEEDVYSNVQLQWIPPEIREGGDEIEAAENNGIPQLVSQEQIKGIIHVHSNYSDGIHSLLELAQACKKQGYSYLGISDHSRTAFYAGGLSIERLMNQVAEIKELNRKLKSFRILAGIESDILADGSLDYPDDVLNKLDFVIGSIHSKLNMDKKEATARLIKAINNKYLTILGHPSGGLLLSREGYSYDRGKVFGALQKNNVVLEHNCNPHRLDPDWQDLKQAAGMGVLIALNPDAHSIEGFTDIRYGCTMARKAWLGCKHILNCLSGEQIDEFFRNRKKN